MLEVKRCLGQRRGNIPPGGTTILDEFPKLIENIGLIKELEMYARDPENHGANILDIYFKDGNMFYIKLPIEMPWQDFEAYVRPLFDAFFLHND